MKTTTTIFLMTTTLLSCSQGKPPEAASIPSATDIEALRAEAPNGAANEGNSDASRLVIEKSIRVACGISDAEAFFAYDSAQLSASGEAMLKKLASCFQTGPLGGRSMTLVGHADERGSEEYNMKLGSRRAESVKNALSSLGLDEKLITTSSRGEQGATGTSSTSWPLDRRVDVTLDG